VKKSKKYAFRCIIDKKAANIYGVLAFKKKEFEP